MDLLTAGRCPLHLINLVGYRCVQHKTRGSGEEGRQDSELTDSYLLFCCPMKKMPLICCGLDEADTRTRKKFSRFILKMANELGGVRSEKQ